MPTETILQYPRQSGARLGPDFFQEAVRVMSALPIEIEVKQHIGNQLPRIALFLIPLASGAKDKNDKSDKSRKSTTKH